VCWTTPAPTLIKLWTVHNRMSGIIGESKGIACSRLVHRQMWSVVDLAGDGICFLDCPSSVRALIFYLSFM